MLVVVLALFAAVAWLIHPHGLLENFWQARQPAPSQSPGFASTPQPVSNIPPVPLATAVQERMEEDGEYIVRVEATVPAQGKPSGITVQFTLKQGANRWSREVKAQAAAGAPTVIAAEFPEPKLFEGPVQAEAAWQP